MSKYVPKCKWCWFKKCQFRVTVFHKFAMSTLSSNQIISEWNLQNILKMFLKLQKYLEFGWYFENFTFFFSLGFNFLKSFILIFQLNYRANFQRLQKQLRETNLKRDGCVLKSIANRRPQRQICLGRTSWLHMHTTCFHNLIFGFFHNQDLNNNFQKKKKKKDL